jgi:hypothetical protein
MTVSVEYDTKSMMPSAKNLRHQEQPMHIETLYAPPAINRTLRVPP